MATAILQGLETFMNGRGSFNPRTVFKFDNLDTRVQRHLTRVYATLACATAITALGTVAHLNNIIIHGFLTQIAALACLITLGFTSAEPKNLGKRYGLLAGFAFCQGLALGPLVGMALFVAPSAIMTACLCTTAVFVCFSISALVTQRRAYMYLGGYLSAASLTLVVLRLSSWMFGRSSGMYSMELYGGLLIFSAYILYDTQLIVERASGGDFDHVRHSLDLLVDLLAVFVRVLVILLRKAEDDKRRERERKGQRRN